MSTILLVFGIAEGTLLFGSLLAFFWGVIRHWELEIMMPIAAAFGGTISLALLLPVVIVIHDHVHVHLG